MDKKEYIERQEVYSEINKLPLTEDAAMEIMWAIDHIPTADVAPVKHGHIVWKKRHRGGFRTAKCLHHFNDINMEHNTPCKHIARIDERCTIDEPYCSECGKLLGDFLSYCGNCGAKMDL